MSSLALCALVCLRCLLTRHPNRNWTIRTRQLFCRWFGVMSRPKSAVNTRPAVHRQARQSFRAASRKRLCLLLLRRNRELLPRDQNRVDHRMTVSARIQAAMRFRREELARPRPSRLSRRQQQVAARCLHSVSPGRPQLPRGSACRRSFALVRNRQIPKLSGLREPQARCAARCRSNMARPFRTAFPREKALSYQG